MIVLCAAEGMPTAIVAADHLRSRFLPELHDPIPPRFVYHLLPRRARDRFLRDLVSKLVHLSSIRSFLLERNENCVAATSGRGATVIGMPKRFHPDVYERR